jgi:hypothetical protein
VEKHGAARSADEHAGGSALPRESYGDLDAADHCGHAVRLPSGKWHDQKPLIMRVRSCLLGRNVLYRLEQNSQSTVRLVPWFDLKQIGAEEKKFCLTVVSEGFGLQILVRFFSSWLCAKYAALGCWLIH